MLVGSLSVRLVSLVALVLLAGLHLYISGVPHRIKQFERIYAYMKRRKGVLFWKGEDILDWYRGTKPGR